MATINADSKIDERFVEFLNDTFYFENKNRKNGIQSLERPAYIQRKNYDLPTISPYELLDDGYKALIDAFLKVMLIDYVKLRVNYLSDVSLFYYHKDYFKQQAEEMREIFSSDFVDRIDDLSLDELRLVLTLWT